jgi:hypothetical protein
MQRCRAGRLHDIVVGGELHVDQLLVDPEHASEAAADRHGPAVTMTRFPVGRNDRRRGQVLAAWKVIVDERLHQHLVDVTMRHTLENKVSLSV